MSNAALLLMIAVLTAAGYVLGKSRALTLVGGNRGMRNLHSLPRYYGLLTALWCLLPCMLVVLVWAGFQNAMLTSMVRQAMQPDRHLQAVPVRPVHE